jgi:hypothetical protein
VASMLLVEFARVKTGSTRAGSMRSSAELQVNFSSNTGIVLGDGFSPGSSEQKRDENLCQYIPRLSWDAHEYPIVRRQL